MTDTFGRGIRQAAHGSGKSLAGAVMTRPGADTADRQDRRSGAAPNSPFSGRDRLHSGHRQRRSINLANRSPINDQHPTGGHRSNAKLPRRPCLPMGEPQYRRPDSLASNRLYLWKSLWRGVHDPSSVASLAERVAGAPRCTDTTRLASRLTRRPLVRVGTPAQHRASSRRPNGEPQSVACDQTPCWSIFGIGLHSRCIVIV
jgi:hypothetical protein